MKVEKIVSVSEQCALACLNSAGMSTAFIRSRGLSFDGDGLVLEETIALDAWARLVVQGA